MQFWLVGPSNTVQQFACKHLLHCISWHIHLSLHPQGALHLHYSCCTSAFPTWMWFKVVCSHCVLTACICQLQLHSQLASSSQLQHMHLHIAYVHVACGICTHNISYKCVQSTQVFWVCISPHCTHASHIQVAWIRASRQFLASGSTLERHPGESTCWSAVMPYHASLVY